MNRYLVEKVIGSERCLTIKLNRAFYKDGIHCKQVIINGLKYGYVPVSPGLAEEFGLFISVPPAANINVGDAVVPVTI